MNQMLKTDEIQEANHFAPKHFLELSSFDKKKKFEYAFSLG